MFYQIITFKYNEKTENNSLYIFVLSFFCPDESKYVEKDKKKKSSSKTGHAQLMEGKYRNVIIKYCYYIRLDLSEKKTIAACVIYI